MLLGVATLVQHHSTKWNVVERVPCLSVKTYRMIPSKVKDLELQVMALSDLVNTNYVTLHT